MLINKTTLQYIIQCWYW